MTINNISIFPLSPMLVETPGRTVVVFVDFINEVLYSADGTFWPKDDPIVVEVLHAVREEKKEVDAFLSSEEVEELISTREDLKNNAPR